MVPSPSLSSLLSSSTTTCGVWFTVDEGGLWISGQRPVGKSAKGLGKTLDLARLERALTALLAGTPPEVARGSDDPCGALWAAVQTAYRAS
mgnify:CR=1 FL=1